MPKIPNPPPRPPKPRYSSRNTPQRLKPKPKSKSNLEKAVGVASFAAKNLPSAAKSIAKAEIAGLKRVGGFFMPQSKPAKMAMIVRKGSMSSKAGTDTRPNEREPKRVAPRQRMPKELESMFPKRPKPKPKPRPMPMPRGPSKRIKPRPMPMPRGPSKRIKPRPMPYGTPRRKKP